MRNDKYIESFEGHELSEESKERILQGLLDAAHEEAPRHRMSKSAMKSIKWIAPIAACLLIAFAVIYGTGAFDKSPASPGPAANPAGTGQGVYIPPIELPDSEDGSAADMIGLFVYKGRIYTDSSWEYGAESPELVGTYLGHGKGNIDEWSTQDEYTEEFAGNIHEDIYTVKGYDPEFRLCVVHDDKTVDFFENLNGIELKQGSDLFGEARLKLKGGWVKADYQKHDDWYYSRNIIKSFENITDEDIDAFIDALYSGEFEYVYETIGFDDFIEYTDSHKQALLQFHMEDGTTIGLFLIEGGYVSYSPLSWYFVKMPGEAFDKILDACE